MANIEGHLVSFDSIPVDPDDEEFDYSQASYGIENEDPEESGKDNPYRYPQMLAQRERINRLALIKKRQEVADRIKKAKTLDEKFVIVKKFHDLYGWDGKGAVLRHTSRMVQLKKKEYEFLSKLNEIDPYSGLLNESDFTRFNSNERKFTRLEFIKYSRELKILSDVYSKMSDSEQKSYLLGLIDNRRELLLKRKKTLMLSGRRSKLADKFKSARIERDILGSCLPTKVFIKKKREYLKKMLEVELSHSR